MAGIRIRPVMWILLASLCATGLPLAADTRTATGQQSSFDQYQVIADRNIYLKDRQPAARPGRVTSILRPEPPPPSPEESTVLTGIVRHGDEYVAFFEDQRTGATRRVRQGQSLYGGTVGTISLDFVEYVKNGQASRIGISENLAKRPTGQASTPITASPAASETPAVASQPAPAPADEAAILEMLRKRRQQEMGNN